MFYLPIRYSNGLKVLSAEAVCDLVARNSDVPRDSLSARELGGGVSNRVWLVTGPGVRLVLKQALPKLRVKEDWFSDLTRIYREAASLRLLETVLPQGSVPRVLFEDQSLYVYAMEAAPSDCTWKALLLEGRVDSAVAERVGLIQAGMMSATWDKPAGQFDDLKAFEQLRLDPYYRFTAAKHPECADVFHRAIERATSERRCLVHGDWSPKNIMIGDGSVMAIDFEVIHFGDPAFDCGFLLNHLLLKSIHRPEFASLYREAAMRYWSVLHRESPADPDWLWRGTMIHLPALLLARVDGKSPAEYLQDDGEREKVRALAHRLRQSSPQSIEELFA